MHRPESCALRIRLRMLLAIYSLILYCLDTGSDLIVSYDLFNKCHYFYASSVLSLVLLPGLVYGWYKKYVGGKDYSIWKVMLAPLWFLPFTLRKLFLTLWYGTAWDQDAKLYVYIL